MFETIKNLWHALDSDRGEYLSREVVNPFFLAASVLQTRQAQVTAEPDYMNKLMGDHIYHKGAECALPHGTDLFEKTRVVQADAVKPACIASPELSRRVRGVTDKVRKGLAGMLVPFDVMQRAHLIGIFDPVPAGQGEKIVRHLLRDGNGLV